MSTSYSTTLPATKDPESTISISLITITGKRHTVRIETKHLACHNIGSVDVFEIPAESLKAILWGRWQRAWGLQPPDPNRIKLVHFGQTINDFTPLRCTFPIFGNCIKLANHSRHYR
ncbi:hypothetical protein DL98DRAFT_279253 [Cadophora sp. DSE1049]|nr:hypothetical protein DL98DRAFT_279253 [Cadophora sp. DSE1049]